jgi:hypothetical protein
MPKNKLLLGLIAASSLALIAPARAADVKTYQVTGPIVEVTDTMIVVMKGKDRWELARSAATKVTGGELKAGEKVTISYTMTADTIEVKAGKAEKPAKDKVKEMPSPAASPAKKAA